MKKKAKGFLALSLLLGGILTSCSSHVQTGVCYSSDRGTYFGDYISRTTVVVNDGYIASAQIEETYSPCVWARVNPNEMTADSIETIEVDDAKLFDGTTGKIYLAKHIKVGDMAFTGALRDVTDTDDDALYERGEYVDYTWDDLPSGTTDSSTYPLDLFKYLSVADSDTYKLGSRYKWYFDAVEDGDIHAYGSITGSTSYDVDYSLGFPGSSYLRSSYSDSSSWHDAVDSLCSFTEGKRLNYVYKVTDSATGNSYKSLKASDGVWCYNPGYAEGTYSDDNWETVTGVTSSTISLDSIKSYFDSLNKAFASVEFSSMI